MTKTRKGHPLLDGQLEARIREATAAISWRLTECGHSLTDIGYLSRVHPETVRLIRSGTRPVASPETLDALVGALDKLDRAGE